MRVMSALRAMPKGELNALATHLTTLTTIIDGQEPQPEETSGKPGLSLMK
jgi:hypothetical protein